MRAFYLVVILLAAPCFGQKLYVYSPLTRIDPNGEIVKPDKGSAEPRHILSPGIPRNATTPLRVVVEMDKPDYYYLEIAQNPENAVRTRLYKELFVQTASGWIPDALQEVSNPYRGFATDFRLPGQKVVTFWLEMTAAKDAPVDRIKVEPQLYVDVLKDWFVYPMEVRVQEPVVPAPKAAPGGNLPPVTSPADGAIAGPLRQALCGVSQEKAASSGEQLTNRELLRRYVEQDLTLVKDKATLETAFRKAAGVDPQRWCQSPAAASSGPEWYLRLRDAIYRSAGAR